MIEPTTMFAATTIVNQTQTLVETPTETTTLNQTITSLDTATFTNSNSANFPILTSTVLILLPLIIRKKKSK